MDLFIIIRLITVNEGMLVSRDICINQQISVTLLKEWKEFYQLT